MGDKTKISWTNFFGENSGATWNPITANYQGKRGWACVRYDPACDNCYAQLLNVRAPFGLGTGLPYDTANTSKVDIVLRNLDQPIRWGKPRGIFTCSMTDLFGDFVPEEYRRAIYAVMGFADQHVFITLTKRISQMVQWYINQGHKPDFEIPTQYTTPAILKAWKKRDGAIALYPNPNVIVGITIGHQIVADRALKHMRLLREHFPSMKIMVSYEPAIGPVNWTGWENIVNWMVVGGESGDEARPMHPDWARRTRDWSVKNSVKFFFKQHGQFIHESQTEKMHDTPLYAIDGSEYYKVGKKQAGDLLDGRSWHQFPEI